MKITIYPHNNLHVSGTTQQSAQQRLERLERYLPRIREVRLELSQQDNRRGEDFTIAQLTLYHERGAILRTEEKVAGMTPNALDAAVNAAVEKMYRRIDRFKGKREDKRRKRARFSPTEEELAVAEDVEELLEEIEAPAEAEQEVFEPIVARRKYITLTPMSELEAIEQMELLGHAFFLYHDQTLDKRVLLYRRSEGDYGLLIPEDGAQA